MVDYIPGPTKNFVPRQNPPKKESNNQTPAVSSAIEPLTEAECLAMDKTALVALVMKMGATLGRVVLMSDETAYETIRLRLLHKGLGENDITKALPVLKEWMDRTKGKSIERTESKSHITTSATGVIGVSPDLMDGIASRWLKRRGWTVTKDNQPHLLIDVKTSPNEI